MAIATSAAGRPQSSAEPGVLNNANIDKNTTNKTLQVALRVLVMITVVTAVGAAIAFGIAGNIPLCAVATAIAATLIFAHIVSRAYRPREEADLPMRLMTPKEAPSSAHTTNVPDDASPKHGATHAVLTPPRVPIDTTVTSEAGQNVLRASASALVPGAGNSVNAATHTGVLPAEGPKGDDASLPNGEEESAEGVGGPAVALDGDEEKAELMQGDAPVGPESSPADAPTKEGSEVEDASQRSGSPSTASHRSALEEAEEGDVEAGEGESETPIEPVRRAPTPTPSFNGAGSESQRNEEASSTPSPQPGTLWRLVSALAGILGFGDDGSDDDAGH